jgi:predicted transcriptional regulator of viral defense system
MKWAELLDAVGEEPVFSSSLLKVGEVHLPGLQVQLARWVEAGKVLRLRRGVYVLARPHRKADPHPFLLANALRANSYVSLQSALAHHGMIPEHVPVVTSVTTSRPESLETGMGAFSFRHLRPPHFFGYVREEVSSRQAAFVATPEKALLDLVYLTPGGEREAYLRELRLQNLGSLDGARLRETAGRFAKPKVERAVRAILRLVTEETGEAP